MSEGFDLLNALGYVSLGIAFISFGVAFIPLSMRDIERVKHKIMGDNSDFINSIHRHFSDEMDMLKAEMLAMKKELRGVREELNDMIKDVGVHIKVENGNESYSVKSKNGKVHYYKGDITVDNKNGKVYVDGMEVRPKGESIYEQFELDKKIQNILSEE